MFSRPNTTFSWKKLPKIKLAAISLMLGGLAATWSGFYRLQELTAASYELSPVLTQCDQEKEVVEIYVDIGGAVANPGMYKLAAGSRLGEVIELAGGFSNDADSGFIASSLNSADSLKDGDKIFIPSLADRQTSDEHPVEDVNNPDTALVSLNQATKKELQSLPQIGEKRAEDIIGGRPYKAIEELLANEIVTKKIYDQIETLISI